MKLYAIRATGDPVGWQDLKNDWNNLINKNRAVLATLKPTISGVSVEPYDVDALALCGGIVIPRSVGDYVKKQKGMLIIEAEEPDYTYTILYSAIKAVDVLLTEVRLKRPRRVVVKEKLSRTIICRLEKELLDFPHEFTAEYAIL